jgi:dihydrolipoamide dehydrogenase (EC 1.8.1.4)
MDFDVAIIGGGTAGYAAGVLLGRRGKRVAVIEKGEHRRYMRKLRLCT